MIVSMSGRTATTLLWLSLGLWGCAGGSSSDRDGTPPTIVFTNPTNTASEIDPSDEIRAVFSEGIDEATLTETTFRLHLPDSTVVHGTVIYDAGSMEAIFRPNSKLSFLTSYRVILTTGIADRSGNHLASEYAWQFRTRDRTWGPATRIGPDSGSSHSAKVAIDPAGNATAVWSQVEGQAPSTTYRILASSFVPDRGWGAPARIDDDRSGYADYPQIDVDDNGNAIAVWQEDSPDPNLTYLVWWNRYSAPAWVGPAIVDPLATAAALPRIRLGGDGDAMAWWIQREGQDRFGGILYDLYANYYERNTGWGPTEHLRANIDPGHHPDVALGRKDGSAMAVWRHFDGTIWAMPYESGNGWSPATQLAALGDHPQVVMDNEGTATVTWRGSNGTSLVLSSMRYQKGAGWESPIEIGAMSSEANMAVDQTGNVTAVWANIEFSEQNVVRNCLLQGYRVSAVGYKVGGGWGSPRPSPVLTIECFRGPLEKPQVAIDGRGNAVVAWSDGVNILVQRYSAQNDSWDRSWVINDQTADANSPQIAMNYDGEAVVVWHQSGATWVNVFN